DGGQVRQVLRRVGEGGRQVVNRARHALRRADLQRLGHRVRQVAGDLEPGVRRVVEEVVPDDEHAAVRHQVRAGVRQAEPAVHVQQEGQQLGGGVEGGVERLALVVELDALVVEQI